MDSIPPFLGYGYPSPLTYVQNRQSSLEDQHTVLFYNPLFKETLYNSRLGCGGVLKNTASIFVMSHNSLKHDGDDAVMMLM